jgi:hypothetical protein
MPKTEVGEHTRLGCCWTGLTSSLLRPEPSRAFVVFREGAETAREGACAPSQLPFSGSFDWQPDDRRRIANEAVCAMQITFGV